MSRPTIKLLQNSRTFTERTKPEMFLSGCCGSVRVAYISKKFLEKCRSFSHKITVDLGLIKQNFQNTISTSTHNVQEGYEQMTNDQGFLDITVVQTDEPLRRESCCGNLKARRVHYVCHPTGNASYNSQWLFNRK